MAENAGISRIGSDDCENKTFEKSPLTFKKLNEATDYLTPTARLAFI